jgi:hypothetical protein
VFLRHTVDAEEFEPVMDAIATDPNIVVLGPDEFIRLFIAVQVNDPPIFTNDPIIEINAADGVAYFSTIADDATDPDSDPLSFSRVAGPMWLSVDPNGVVSGTPSLGDLCVNSFTVQVEDGYGGMDQTTLDITVLPRGDFDGDCAVNTIDLGIMAEHWKLPGTLCDLDGSGEVGTADLTIQAGHWLITY